MPPLMVIDTCSFLPFCLNLVCSDAIVGLCRFDDSRSPIDHFKNTFAAHEVETERQEGTSVDDHERRNMRLSKVRIKVGCM
jgi:hypothetical protein